MNNVLKNILVTLFSLVISYFVADYFGIWYTTIFGYGSAWIGSEESWNFIIGLPLSLSFFLTLILNTWIFKKITSTVWLISPLILYEVIVDIRHIYITLILIILAFSVSSLLKKYFNLTTQ